MTGYAGMPLIGTYCDQSTLGSGWLLEEFNGANVTGKYWPRSCPVDAVTNGFENVGGAGLLYVVPYGALAASTPMGKSLDRGVIHAETGAQARPTRTT